MTDETQNAGEYLSVEMESSNNFIMRTHPHFRVVNAIADAASVCRVHTEGPNATCMVALGIAMEAAKWYAFHIDTQEARMVKEGVEKAIACFPLWDEQTPIRLLLETLLLLPIDPGGKREIQGYIRKIKEGRWK